MLLGKASTCFHYLSEVAVAVDELLLMTVLQLVVLDVEPGAESDHAFVVLVDMPVVLGEGDVARDRFWVAQHGRKADSLDENECLPIPRALLSGVAGQHAHSRILPHRQDQPNLDRSIETVCQNQALIH